MSRTKPARNRVVLWLLLSLASLIFIGAIGMAIFT
jgi:preprotein translocase subunit Sss1